MESNQNPVRLDTDPRIAVDAADLAAIDLAAIDRGEDYTPTDLALIKAGNHPYFVVAS
jgi:hypothetical protein